MSAGDVVIILTGTSRQAEASSAWSGADDQAGVELDGDDQAGGELDGDDQAGVELDGDDQAGGELSAESVMGRNLRFVEALGREGPVELDAGLVVAGQLPAGLVVAIELDAGLVVAVELDAGLVVAVELDAGEGQLLGSVRGRRRRIRGVCADGRTTRPAPARSSQAFFLCQRANPCDRAIETAPQLLCFPFPTSPQRRLAAGFCLVLLHLALGLHHQAVHLVHGPLALL